MEELNSNLAVISDIDNRLKTTETALERDNLERNLSRRIVTHYVYTYSTSRCTRALAVYAQRRSQMIVSSILSGERVPIDPSNLSEDESAFWTAANNALARYEEQVSCSLGAVEPGDDRVPFSVSD